MTTADNFRQHQEPGRMHIAIVCLDKSGGLTHCAYHFARTMAGIAEVTCFLTAQNDMITEFEALPCQVRVFPFRRGGKALLASIITGRETSGIAQAIAEVEPDVVLDTGSGGWGGVVLKRLHGRVPIAQIVHDVFPHPDLRSIIDAVPGFVQAPIADMFIGLSDYSYRQLARKYPNKKCVRAGVGIILPSGAVNVAKVAERRHKQLFLGRIHAYKGLKILVDAFDIAKQLDSRLELQIVGSGRIASTLRRRIAELGIKLDNRYVSDTEIRDAVMSHGVMILPYVSATQSGIAAVALANGMPCVATSVGALPEQVIDGRNGLIVPPGDSRALAKAMVTISSDESLARRMAEESLRIGRDDFAWEAISQQLHDDLTELVAGKN